MATNSKYCKYPILFGGFILLILFISPVSFSQQKTTSFPLFFEKVYVHTDREYYVAGDDLWFAAYLVNGKSNLPMGTSNNLYVQLIAPGEKPVIVDREVVRVDSGFGHGDFRLSDSLISGIYRLRAYTNWMRNFDDNFIFEKTIHITGSKENKKDAKPSAEKRKDDIQFFPEGGTLVDDVTSVVAFKAEDANGNGLDASGSVISSLGDTVCNFSTTHAGMGKFNLLPKAGVSYTAIGKFRNKIQFSKDLPFAVPNGFAMQVVVRDTNGILVNIATNEVSLEQYKNNILSLKALNHGKTIFALDVPLNQLQTTLRIPGSYFPAGVTALTLFDPSGKPQCERIIYISSPRAEVLNVTAGKTSDESTEVSLSLKNAPKGSSAHVSIAAVDARTVPDGVSNIFSYLQLESEIKGTIENPGSYFDTANLNRLSQLDLLLLTQGWRSFIWRRMKDTTLTIKYAPEAGFSISGKVRQRLINKLIVKSNITMLLSGGGKNSLQGIQTDDDGKFYFNGLNFYGTRKLTITSKNKSNEALGWILMDSLYIPIKIPIYKQFESDSVIPQIFKELITIKKKKYSLKDTIELPEFIIKKKKNDVLVDNEGESSFSLGQREFNVTPDDTSFFNFDMFLYNLAPDLVPPINKENGEEGKPQYLLCYREDYKEMKKKGLSYMVYYRDSILPDQLPINKIAKIIIKKMGGTDSRTDFYYVCIYPKPGVSLNRPEFYKLEERITGYYQARTFYTPHNVTFSDSNSDLKPTLYWKPDIVVTNQEVPVRIYSGKVTGNFKVFIQGITNNGNVIYSEKDYKSVK